MSDALAGIIFGSDFSGQPNTRRPARVSASTGHQIVQISARLGQARFSENVRDNYDYRCCFPDCSATDRRFLIGAHIARWNDVPELRGQTANGLCLCLFHDKAFEIGVFTLTSDLRVAIGGSAGADCPWASSMVAPFAGRSVRTGFVKPALVALQHHWSRIGFTP
jgi:hypothetical protein